MTESMSDDYEPVSRELVLQGILPWAGPRYERDLRRMIRENPYDPLVLMVSRRLLEVYRDHPPANGRMSSEQAARLGLTGTQAHNPNSFMNRVRRALGNPG